MLSINLIDEINNDKSHLKGERAEQFIYDIFKKYIPEIRLTCKESYAGDLQYKNCIIEVKNYTSTEVNQLEKLSRDMIINNCPFGVYISFYKLTKSEFLPKENILKIQVRDLINEQFLNFVINEIKSYEKYNNVFHYDGIQYTLHKVLTILKPFEQIKEENNIHYMKLERNELIKQLEYLKQYHFDPIKDQLLTIDLNQTKKDIILEIQQKIVTTKYHAKKLFKKYIIVSKNYKSKEFHLIQN